MIKSLRTLFVALIIVPLAACQTVPLKPIDLSLTNQSLLQELIGVWEGSWLADNGSINSFRLTIKSINQAGYITGSRMYATKKFGSKGKPMEGNIIDGQLHLDNNKGQDRWIKLKLHRDQKSGQLWLKGRYSTIGGGTVYLGDIDIKKVSQ